MKRFKRVLMVLYSIIFVFLLISFNMDNFEIGYHIALISWSIIFDTVVGIGNFLYAFNLSNKIIRKMWKFVFPILTLNFFLFMYLDLTVTEDIQSENEILLLLMAIFGFIIYLPTFWAGYNLGYRNSNLNRIAYNKI